MATLVQAAWGAVRTQGSIFQRKYRRWEKRMGSRKALIAVCHSLLVVAYEPVVKGRSDAIIGRDYKVLCIVGKLPYN